MPSRLRPYHDFEASLAGDGGRHTIFELQSTLNPENSNSGGNDDESPKARTDFDIDFSYDGEQGKTPSIFNQVQVLRGDDAGQSTEPVDGDIGRVRKLRLYNSEPMLQR